MGLKGTDKVELISWIKDLTYNEIHLLILGLYSGFVAVRPTPRQYPKDMNWERNEWYWKGGYVIGYILKIVIILIERERLLDTLTQLIA